MKNKMRLIFIPILILMFLSSACPQEREVPPVELKKISDNLFEIIGGRGAQGGAYIGDNGILIIDSKMNKESVEQTIIEIKKITDKPIKYLINTHSDGDHIIGNQFFPEAVTFIAHENCHKEFFHPKRDGSPSDWNNSELAPFIPSITFREKMDIYLGSKKVEIWYFGVGHTTGDAVVYFPEEKTAFIGDQIFVTRPQLIHSYKGGNSFEHVKTLSKMLETLNAEHFCSGHDDMVDRRVIKLKIGIMKDQQEKVRQLINQGLSLEAVKTEFNENESRLVESIFNEIKQGF